MRVGRIWDVLFAMLVTLSLATPVWAQEEAKKVEPSWVMSYLLVVVCTGIGLFVVCRGTKREK